MAGIEDLYQNILGRASDAEGLQFWQQQQTAGMSLDQISQAFYGSAEYQSRQGSSQMSTTGTVVNQGGTSTGKIVNGVDLSQYTWDQIATEVHNDKLTRSQGDGGDMYGGYGYSSILGMDVQGYVDTNYDRYVREKGYVRPDDFGVDANQYANLSNLNFKAKDGPEGYMTSLYRNEDGSVGVGYYLEEDNFLMDMVQFVAAAYTMYTGINMVGGALSGAGAAPGGATSGASVGGSSAAGVAPVTETGFQVTQLTAPWEPVANNALGSGLNGIDAVDGLLKLGSVGADGSFSLGGMTLLPDGSLVAAGDLFAKTAPWINPASSTITDIVINSAGSVTDLLAGVDPWSQYVAGMGDVLPPETGLPKPGGADPTDSGKSWWDDVPEIVKDIGKGIVTGAIVDAVTPKPSVPGGGGAGTGTPGAPIINIPKPDPTASALQPAANQRAGVKFGRTKSKRQLKGKFSGTGITLG
jgi:hypothetical protein